MSKFKILATNILILLIAFILNLDVVQAENSETYDILIFQSYHEGMLWTDTITEGIKDELESSNIHTRLHIEYMDTKRNSTEAIFPLLKKLYSEKYDESNVDLIIISDDNAYNFMLQFGDSLFPGAPVVFCGVNNFNYEQIEHRTNYTGIVENVAIFETLKTALELHPETKDIFIVNDHTTTGTALRKEVLKALSRLSLDISIHFLESMTMTELQENLRNLPSRSLVLLLSFNRDSRGNTFSYREAIEQIAPYANAPMYGVWEFYLGRGIVGGKLTSGREHGKAAALMGLQILQGKPVGDIPIRLKKGTTYMFDYKLLKKYSIPERQLPAGSKVVNEPATLFYKYREFVLITFFTIIALFIFSSALLVNVLKRKRAEKALKNSERRLSNFLTNLPGMAYCRNVDENMTMEFVSEGCRNLVGYTPDELVGNRNISFDEMIHMDDRQQVCQQVKSSIEAEEPYRIEYRILTSTGKEKWVWEQGRLIETGVDEMMLEGFIVDISERKKAEKEILENAKLKSEFVTTAAHEFRTPLTSIQGYSELMLLHEDISKEERREFLTYIHERSKGLGKIVEELLDIGRYEAGQRVALNCSVTSVDKVFIEIKRIVFSQSYEKRCSINSNDLDSQIFVDQTKILQIFENLLSNAIKYSPPYTKIEIIGKKLDDKKYLFSISDKGIGMTPEQLGRVFDKFFRADASATAPGGLGLGMSVVKQIVELHGGEIFVESTENLGTTVSFTLPIRSAAENIK